MAVAHWPRRPLPSVRSASLPDWKAPPLPPLLEGVAENVALASILASSRIWERAGSAELAPSKRMAEAVSGILPREDKATAMRALSRSGKPSAARSGPAVSTLMRKVSA